MMTHDLEVSIIAAPLDAMDRRALSQAWYSALRLAAPQAGCAKAGITRSAAPVTRFAVAARPAEVARPIAETHRAARACARAAGDNRLAETVVPLRRAAPHRALAARIERAFGNTAPPPKRATFSLGRGNARVVVVLQSTPGSATLVALCRPELRAAVGHALIQARIALAARGIASNHWRIGGDACF